MRSWTRFGGIAAATAVLTTARAMTAIVGRAARQIVDGVGPVSAVQNIPLVRVAVKRVHHLDARGGVINPVQGRPVVEDLHNRDGFSEQIPQLLAALRKTTPHESEKDFRVVVRQFVGRARRYANKGRINIWLRKKNARWNGAQIIDAVVKLDNERKRAVITRPG